MDKNTCNYGGWFSAFQTHTILGLFYICFLPGGRKELLEAASWAPRRSCLISVEVGASSHRVGRVLDVPGEGTGLCEPGPPVTSRAFH